jgi:hypothetical protein
MIIRKLKTLFEMFIFRIFIPIFIVEELMNEITR